MVTHGIGAVLAVLGLVALLGLALVDNDIRVTISLTIYGATLVLLYLASTLYHAIRHKPTKLIFKTCDHAAIFPADRRDLYALLPAGAGRRLGLDAVRGGLEHRRLRRRLQDFPYQPLCPAFPDAVSRHRLGRGAGGRADHREHGNDRAYAAGAGRISAYTGGVAFFVWESMPFNHAVWHLFVLAGSTCHFLSIYYYVAQGVVSA